MQNPMKNPQPLYVLLPVPFEALEDAGIGVGDLMQFTVADGRLIMERVDPKEADLVCDGDCESCPLHTVDCDGDCENCPCNKNCDESEVF